MGKGTIVAHKGEGLYTVKLRRSTRHLGERIAEVDRDLTALQDDLIEALANREAAANALNVAQNDIDGKIRSINAKYADLQKKIAEDKKAVSDAEEAVLRAQADVDYLKDLRSEGIEVTDQQMADAESVLATKKADLSSAKAVLADDEEKWTNRDQDLDKIGELVAKGAEIGETYRQAEFAYQNLIIKRTALTKDKAWLTAKKKADPTVDAWCADLTTTLTGDVGTIEVPGERTNDLGDVQIRPGFDHRAEYQSAEQVQNLIDALSHAIDERNTAQDRYDAAVTALANGNKRVIDLQQRLGDLQRRPRETEDTYGYLTDADGNRIVTAKGITEAEIVEAQGQLKAAQAQVPVLTDRKATMATALTAAKATAKAAEQALDAARTAEQKPRNADGLLQTIAAAPGPFSSFFNRTLLPAWEKWKPLYRLGEITELSGDTCTVKLDETKSSQQAINVNREPVLHAVPIQYMDCNGEAFAVGDRVIVEFLYHDQDRPRVIGFEDHPRECGNHGMVGALAGDDAPKGYTTKAFGKLHYATYSVIRPAAKGQPESLKLFPPPAGSKMANAERAFGPWDWVYKVGGTFKGYLTWGQVDSKATGLFTTWLYRYPLNEYARPPVGAIDVIYEGSSSAEPGDVFLNGTLLVRPSTDTFLSGQSVLGAAIRHVRLEPTEESPEPGEVKYLLLVLNGSGHPTSIGDENDYFGATVYAVDISDGPVTTNADWNAKARLIHTAPQVRLTLPSIGASAYGGMDTITGRGSAGVRFRFNGSATRASCCVHCAAMLGYNDSTAGGSQWADWAELPVVLHLDIADTLAVTQTIEDPVIGNCWWNYQSWHHSGGMDSWGTVYPDRPNPPPEMIYDQTGSGSASTPATTTMIDYIDDREVRMTASETASYNHRTQGYSWDGGNVYQVEMRHQVTHQIGRHTLVEEVIDHKPQGSIAYSHQGGYKNVRYHWLAIDLRYDFYAALRITYTAENPGNDPAQPALSAGVLFELVINGTVIRSSTTYAEWFDFFKTELDEFGLPQQAFSVEWDSGGPFAYLSSNLNTFNAFSTTQGTLNRAGRSAIRPVRRGMFRINAYRHWPEDIPHAASTLGLCPRLDIAPYALIATDVTADEQNPKTLFVTYCPSLSSVSLSGKREDGLGIVYQHEWIMWFGDADSNEVDFPSIAGKSPDVHPRFCGVGLV